jgi:hypothetical protein
MYRNAIKILSRPHEDSVKGNACDWAWDRVENAARHLAL